MELSWVDRGVPATDWWLYIGSRTGGRDLYNSGPLGTAKTMTATGLPVDSREVFVRLWFKVGDDWQYADFRYVAAGVGWPNMVDPFPSSRLLGPTVTFIWTDNGAPVTEWWLYVGSGLGAVPS